MDKGGVIVWEQRLLVYRQSAGGWHAQFLGDDRPLPLADALRQAIEADQRHQQSKRLDDSAS